MVTVGRKKQRLSLGLIGRTVEEPFSVKQCTKNRTIQPAIGEVKVLSFHLKHKYKLTRERGNSFKEEQDTYITTALNHQYYSK